MKPFPIVTAARALGTAVLILFSAGAYCQEQATLDPGELAARYPKGSIDSVETADRALADLSRTRAAINARYAQEEQACLPNFFTTSCIDKAKEKQREALKRLRPVELEANRLKRQVRVEKRDADLAERQEKAEAKRIEVESAPPSPPRSPKDPAPEKVARPGAAQTTDQRVAEHEARRRAQEEKEQAQAGRRAERAEAYERKVQASKKRQEEVARRKAEKEARRRAKEQAGETSSPAAAVRP